MGAPGQDATTFMRKLRPVTEPKGALQQLLEHYEQAVRVEWGVGGVVNGGGVGGVVIETSSSMSRDCVESGIACRSDSNTPQSAEG